MVVWGGLALAFGLLAAYLVLLANDPIPIDKGDLPWIILQSTIAFSYSATGALIVGRRPDNRIGWVFFGAGILTAFIVFASEYDIRAFNLAPGSLPAPMVIALGSSAVGSIVWPTEIFLLLLLFPDGRLPSSRWWPVLGLSLLLPILGLFELMDPNLFGSSLRSVRLLTGNPIAVPALQNIVHTIRTTVVGIGFLIALLGAVLAILRRWLRSTGIERQQLKWLAFAGVLLALSIISFFAPYRAGIGGTNTSPIRAVGFLAFLLAVSVGIPAATAIAILRYRLYDIDLVINRSLVFGTLALFIAGVYVGVVAGLGALIGGRGRPNLALSIVATALVAVAFQPVRERVERLANRLVYGKRATPYEVLSQFSDRVAGTYASEEVLPRMAQVLAEGTAAARADVWLRIGDHLAPAASWPAKDGPAPETVTLTGQLLSPMPTLTRVLPVRHEGELLGALSIKKRPGEAVTPVEDDLLKNLAAQAGLVLRNVRLTAELRARLEEISKQAAELRESRQRIVAAQDAERRRLERNIHDGAQQNLVALTVKLRLATSLAKRNPEGARVSVKELAAESDQALATLRALARGIYPPLLREQGLAAAVRAEAAKMPLPVTVRADHLDRFPPEVEAAVYFVCLEALQNVTKHARASRVQVTLRSVAHELSFEVTDDGAGFEVPNDASGSGLRNMTDRIEGIGGRLVIQSGANQGTTVIGRVPVAATEAVS